MQNHTSTELSPHHECSLNTIDPQEKPAGISCKLASLRMKFHAPQDTCVIDDESAVAEPCPLTGAIRKAVRLAIRIFSESVEDRRQFRVSVAGVSEGISEGIDLLRAYKCSGSSASEEDCYDHHQRLDHAGHHDTMKCHCTSLETTAILLLLLLLRLTLSSEASKLLQVCQPIRKRLYFVAAARFSLLHVFRFGLHMSSNVKRSKHGSYMESDLEFSRF